MAAHRYWRVFVTNGTGVSVIAGSLVEFRDTVGGTNLCTGGTADCSSFFGGFPASNAFDGVSSDAWAAQNNTNEWLSYDFGSGVSYDIIEVGWACRSGFVSQGAIICIVQSSDDNATWNNEWNMEFDDWTSGLVQYRHKDTTSLGANPHRYWRIYGTTLSSVVAGAEAELHATASGSNIALNGRTTLSSGSNSQVVFNGDIHDVWNTNTATNEFIQYDFVDAERTVVEFNITARDSTPQCQQAPNSGKVASSDDGSTWNDEWTYTFPVATVSEVLTSTQPIIPPEVDLYLPELRVFNVFDAEGDLDIPSLRVFAIYNFPADNVTASQTRVLHPVTVDAPVLISQARVFAVARGRMDNRRLRCWTFSLDGHDFYVIRLGETSTLVYDTTTQQWMDWQSPDLPFWRANVGMNWIGMGPNTLNGKATSKVVVGDDSAGLLWTLDPTEGVDQSARDDREDVPFVRKVVGGLPMRLRETQSVGAVYLTADIGTPQTTLANVTLRTSDDNGKNWTDQGTITVEPGNYDQEFVWRSLGLIKAPGRIFEISDNGATVRIDGLDMR